MGMKLPILPSTPLDVALFWAGQGWLVFPCKLDKAPYTERGVLDASNDENQIRQWWTRWPRAAIGGATGWMRAAIDLDCKEGQTNGLEVWKAVAEVDAPTLWTSRTPSGGIHRVYDMIDNHPSLGQYPWFGIDVRNQGGYILLPGSVVAAGTYELLTWSEPDTRFLSRIDWVKIDHTLKEVNPETKALWEAHLAEKERKRLERQAAARAKREALAVGQPTPPQRRNPTRLVAPLNVTTGGGVKAEADEAWIRIEELIDELNAAPEGQGYDERSRICFEAGSRIVRHGQADEDAVIRAFQSGLRWSYRRPEDEETVMRDIAHQVREGVLRGTGAPWRTSRRPPARTVPTMPPASPGTNPPVVGASTPGSALVVAGEAPERVKQFWDRRPQLAEVWFRAQIGGASPWAVLGCLLAEVVVRVGPHVRIPPKGGVGKAASLNMLFALSGDSGDGKGLAAGVASGMIGPPIVPPRKPGTGQGIAAMYSEQTKDGPIQVNDTVLLDVKEITTLGAHASMQGSNLVPTLLEVYMAEALGEHYADKEKRRPVHEGTYRLALVAGVQPTNAGIILDHAGSGLPQRFVWLPAFWPDAVLPDSSDIVPPAPGPELPRWRADTWMLPGSLDDTIGIEDDWQPTDAAQGLRGPGQKKDKEPAVDPVPVKDTILVTYEVGVGREIDRDHRRRMAAKKKRVVSGEQTSGDPDAHLLLTKIKVAVALALWLNGNAHISPEMWDLASDVLWISNATRIAALRDIQKANANKAAQRGAESAVRDVARDAEVSRRRDEETQKLAARVSQGILRRLPTDWTSGAVVARGISSSDKAKLKTANLTYTDLLEDLERVGSVEQREPVGVEQGTKWRRKQA